MSTLAELFAANKAKGSAPVVTKPETQTKPTQLGIKIPFPAPVAAPKVNGAGGTQPESGQPLDPVKVESQTKPRIALKLPAKAAAPAASPTSGAGTSASLLSLLRAKQTAPSTVESEGTQEDQLREESRAQPETTATHPHPQEDDAPMYIDGELIQDDADEIAEVEGEDDIEAETVATGFASDRLQIADLNLILDESQLAAVRGLSGVHAGCLTGAAGTGKTTTTRMLLHCLINGRPDWGLEPLRLKRVNLREYRKDMSEEELKSAESDDIIPSICMCAFTGQATQVIKKHMPGLWHKNVMTIHSMLGYAPEDFVNEKGEVKMRFAPTYNEHFKMPWDVIIFDESSMISVGLFREVLAASKPGTRFYFIGDINQLTPPIGDGILGYAMAKLPVFELTHVHRQKDEAANRIVETAHKVLNGLPPEFDDATTNHNWRVIGFEIDNSAEKAHQQIVSIARALADKRVSAEVDPDRPLVYDPWRDRILTNGNGENDMQSSSLVGQYPLNESLSKIFADPDKPRIIIDSGINKKRFAAGYRVMATANEPANMPNRVTNGLTGIIQTIEINPDYMGDMALVGDENVVAANREAMVLAQLGDAQGIAGMMKMQEESAAQAAEAFKGFDITAIKFDPNASAVKERNQGPASHIVTVKFDNGATRKYTTKAQVEQLRIAYASTVHKAQGAEMPTVIVVLHHAMMRMLKRESLYTAITRASQRVIILYTQRGLRASLAKQEIWGATIEEKVKQYINNLGGENGQGLKTISVSFEPK